MNSWAPQLNGQVAIVTGGAGLLGREYCRALLAAGALVVVADINRVAAEQLTAELVHETRGCAVPVAVDVSNKELVTAMVRQTIAKFDRVDILVNNAAIDPKFDRVHAAANATSFEEFPLESWNHAIAVNLTGMFLCAQAVAKPMLQRGGGVIVNISSTYGLVGPDQRLYESTDFDGERFFKPVSYSVTKSAVFGLTRYLATYWARQNIRVNTLTLGGVFNEQNPEFVRRYSDRTPMARMADAYEYCGALLFLVSDQSSYMNGANLVVDGGWTAW